MLAGVSSPRLHFIFRKCFKHIRGFSAAHPCVVWVHLCNFHTEFTVCQWSVWSRWMTPLGDYGAKVRKSLWYLGNVGIDLVICWKPSAVEASVRCCPEVVINWISTLWTTVWKFEIPVCFQESRVSVIFCCLRLRLSFSSYAPIRVLGCRIEKMLDGMSNAHIKSMCSVELDKRIR